MLSVAVERVQRCGLALLGLSLLLAGAERLEARPLARAANGPVASAFEPLALLQGKGKGHGKHGGGGGKGKGKGKGGLGLGAGRTGGWTTGLGAAPEVTGGVTKTAPSSRNRPMPELPPALPPPPVDKEPAPEKVHFPESDPGTEREVMQAYFDTCDRDHNGWISYREASDSLELERGEYSIYDRDQDGRVTRQEFAMRYRALLELTGAFRIPDQAGKADKLGKRSPLQLRNAYDQDADGALDQRELEALLADYDRPQLSAEIALEKLDRDESHKVEGAELQQLARLIFAREKPAREAPPPMKQATLEDLFGKPEPRGVELDSAPEPPRIPGPASHFRRLDLDGDGRITLADLQKLQTPLQLNVRVSAVLATLDLDEDGGLSEREFLTQIGGRAR